MANKKLTPIQRAIELITKDGYTNPDTAAKLVFNLRQKEVKEILESLLPKEKEFAKEIFEEGQTSVESVVTHDENDTELETTTDFETFFRRYEQ